MSNFNPINSKADKKDLNALRQEVEAIELTPGLDGKSAYQLWLEAGNSGTVQQYLASLVGPKGDDGNDGPSGLLTAEGTTPLTLTYDAPAKALTGQVDAYSKSQTDSIANGKANVSHTHLLAAITDAGTAASRNVGIANGNVPTLDANGKLNPLTLPALAITDTYVINSQAAMLALSADTGDVAIRTDLSRSFILRGTNPGTLSEWSELLTPSDSVGSVNGMTGTVTLTTSNITEGSNLYYTNARAAAAAPVQSVNTKTGAAVLNAADVGALASTGGSLTGTLTVAEIKATAGGDLVFRRPDNTDVMRLQQGGTVLFPYGANTNAMFATVQGLKSSGNVPLYIYSDATLNPVVIGANSTTQTGNKLDVASAAVFRSTITAAGPISTTSNASIGGTLNVTGNTTFGGNLTIATGKTINFGNGILSNIDTIAAGSIVASTYSGDSASYDNLVIYNGIELTGTAGMTMGGGGINGVTSIDSNGYGPITISTGDGSIPVNFQQLINMNGYEINMGGGTINGVNQLVVEDSSDGGGIIYADNTDTLTIKSKQDMTLYVGSLDDEGDLYIQLPNGEVKLQGSTIAMGGGSINLEGGVINITGDSMINTDGGLEINAAGTVANVFRLSFQSGDGIEMAGNAINMDSGELSNASKISINSPVQYSPLSFGTSLYYTGGKLALYEDVGGSDLYGFGVTAGSVDFYAAGVLAAQFTAYEGTKIKAGLYIANQATPPTPTGGGVLFFDASNVLKVKYADGSVKTVTVS